MMLPMIRLIAKIETPDERWHEGYISFNNANDQITKA
jgi:hypothetical protein